MSAPLRIVAWFSAGAASAVAAKLTLDRYGQDHEVVVARCDVPDEHPDGNRFARDCEAWFGVPVRSLVSDGYADCEAVWADRKYMSGVKGAPCTEVMKKAVRRRFEAEWKPDLQAFGFTAEESTRAERFRLQNPEMGLICPLVKEGLTKADCHALIAGVGIAPHAMYALGFPNANCIGCVKSDSPSYWNLVREHFPDVFARRAAQSREIGCRLIKTTKAPRVRMFLDELPAAAGAGEPMPDNECSLLCNGSSELAAD